MTKIKVFVSGPYSKGDVVLNVRAALDAADKLSQAGFLPFCPHLNHFWHLVHPHDPDFWYSYDLEWLKDCDVLLRLPGESWGADQEVEKAKTWGIPVFYSMEALICHYQN